MRKILLVTLLAVLLVSPSFAGTLNVTGRAGLYGIPGSSSTSAMYGLGADYDLSENLSLRGAVETTSYSSGGSNVTYMPITVDIIYGQTIANGLRPYAGAGLSYNNTTVSGGGSTQTAGGQAEAGIQYNFGGLIAGIEYRYLIPDLNHLDRGSSTYNGAITGQVSQSFQL